MVGTPMPRSLGIIKIVAIEASHRAMIYRRKMSPDSAFDTPQGHDSRIASKMNKHTWYFMRAIGFA